MFDASAGAGTTAGNTALQQIQTLVRFTGVAALAFLGVVTSANAATLTFTDKAAWLSHLSASTDFSLDASNVALATEVAVPPPNNSLLGLSLTFAAGNTGLPFGFTFAVDATEEVPLGGNQIIYVEQLVGNGLGISSSFNEHDWVVNFSDPVFVLGMTVRGNGSFDDGLAFLASTGLPLGSFASPPNPAFFGIISDTPISRFLYDDSNVSGGRVLIEMSTGTVTAVSEPGSLAIAGLGLVGLCAARRKRRYT